MTARKKRRASDRGAGATREAQGRKDRILDVAIRLAEEGGFENVRQRDVAEKAGVALGTLYKSFRGKEDLLSAALERQTDVLERQMEAKPPKGDTAHARISSLFQALTRAFCKKPNYARAVIKAMASGEPEIAANLVAYQSQLYRMIVTALRGADHPTPDAEPNEEELLLALLLQQVWFAALVGWSARLHGVDRAIAQVELAARLLIAGLAANTRA
jgi:AcrR family transcriptional regulator